MKRGLLYTFAIAGVLLVAACGPGEGSSGEELRQDAAASQLADADQGVEVAPATPDETTSEPSQGAPVVLFLGDSITAGYGLDPNEAFPKLLEDYVDSASVPAVLVNGGLSGETSAGGLRRIDWLLQRPIDVLFLELGGNDGLRGIDLSSTQANLQEIIDKAREKNPQTVVIVAGMMIPPNFGQDYTEAFQAMYPAIAEANDALLIPFLLDGVGGIDALMQSDGIHPNAEGHQAVAELVAPYLLDALGQVTAPSTR